MSEDWDELWSRGASALRAGRLEEAEAVYRQLAGRPVDAAKRAEAEFFLADVLSKMPGRLIEAEDQYLNALRLYSQTTDIQTTWSAIVSSNMGDVLAKLGRTDEAAHIHRAALHIIRDSDATDSLVPIVMSRLAKALETLGSNGQAEELLREALALHREWYGENDERTADALSDLGEFLLNTGRYEESERLLRQALQIDEEHFGPTDAKKVAMERRKLRKCAH